LTIFGQLWYNKQCLCGLKIEICVPNGLAMKND
jgi:hypothetical protein